MSAAPAYDPMAAQAMVRALAPQQQVAGQVLPMTPNTGGMNADELYRRILQSPSGMQQLSGMSPSAVPQNVVPIRR